MTAMPIPRQLHMIWLGDEMPAEYRRYAGSWVRLHSKWEFTLWGERELAELPMRLRDLYDAAEREAPNDAIRWRVDVARLEILFRFGGCYVDADAECLKPLDPLLQHRMFLPQSPNDPTLVTNAIMGSVPGHPFLDALIRDLPGNAAAHRGRRLVDTVGGKYVTRQLAALKPTGVTILPWWLFAAQSIRDRDRGLPAKPHPDAYARHVYGNSRGRRRR